MLRVVTRPGFAKRAATYEDLLKVPDHLVAEILEGELYASPRPSVQHALAASSLGAELGGPFHQGRGGPGGWWILDEPELHLDREVVVPDLAGWRRSRLPQLPDAAAITTAPGWVCEILSPSTEALDRVAKLPVYAREGVTHVWFVNPEYKRWKCYASNMARGSLWPHTTETRLFTRNRSRPWPSTCTGSGAAARLAHSRPLSALARCSEAPRTLRRSR
jgi:Uma2 family endonuclease